MIPEGIEINAPCHERVKSDLAQVDGKQCHMHNHVEIDHKERQKKHPNRVFSASSVEHDDDDWNADNKEFTGGKFHGPSCSPIINHFEAFSSKE